MRIKNTTAININNTVFSKLCRCFFMIVGLISCPMAYSAGAGVLVYCEIDGEALVLIADHKKASQSTRGWSSLGGTIQPDETEVDAAVREVYEESHGVISRNELYEAIDPSLKVVTPGFVVFFAKTPCYSTNMFNDIAGGYHAKGSAERGPYQWLPWKELKRATTLYKNSIEANPKIRLPQQYKIEGEKTDWYFNAFLATMIEVMNMHQVPMEMKSSNHHAEASH
jgi:8-oxo-dGTP pyrophosphatase MutT (NUDIX family)